MKTSATIKDVRKIKEVVDFLNSEYSKTFYALLIKSVHRSLWQIVCMDWDLYMNDQNLDLCKRAVIEKYPELDLVFCYMVKMFPTTAEGLQKSARWRDENLLIIK